jgi:DNA polymerase-3 subunit gamma/tau
LLEVSGELRSRYLNQANNAPASFLLNAMNLANQCEVSYKTSKNKRLHVELGLMKITQLSNVLTIVSTGNIPEVKKNSSSVTITEEKPSVSHNVSEKSIAATPEIVAPKVDEVIEAKAEKTVTVISEKAFTPPVQPTIVAESKTEVARPKKNFSLGVVSIGKLDEAINKPKEEVHEAEGLFPVQEIPKDVVTTAWNNFAKKIAEEKPHVASVYRSNEPIVADGAIKVVVNTLVQKNEFEDSKQDFLDYLKLHYEINRVSFIVEVVKDAEGTIKRAFTKDEKLEQMIQKNPHIITLMQELDLK